MYEAHGGTGFPQWASYFSHAICELMSKNRRCPPLCSYIAKNVWSGGGCTKPLGRVINIVYIHLYMDRLWLFAPIFWKSSQFSSLEVLTELDDPKNTDTALELLTQLFREEAASRYLLSYWIIFDLILASKNGDVEWVLNRSWMGIE